MAPYITRKPIKTRTEMKASDYIGILSLAALCLGCSDTMEDTHDAAAIRFSAFGEWSDERPLSRIVNGAEFEADDAIGVFACYDPSTDGSGTFTPNYMYNQLVKYDGAEWTYSPIKYWPTDGRIEFWGYYPYHEKHSPTQDGLFEHVCNTGFEPLYQAKATVTAVNGNLSGLGENGKLQLGFLPMLNKTHFTIKTETGLFDEEGLYTVCRFLILEFRVWGFPKVAEYDITTKKWIAGEEFYTKENPLDLTPGLRKVRLDSDEGQIEVPGYKYDPDNGYYMTEALVIDEGADPKHLFYSPVYFIPLTGADPDNPPTFEAKYVVLTNPENQSPDTEGYYKESDIVTRSGSLSVVFDNQGLIEKNITIHLIFSADGVTVTRTLHDYKYKPMF